MELDHSGYQTSSATIYAGNLGDNKYILQVTPSGASLMDGGEYMYSMIIKVGLHYFI